MRGRDISVPTEADWGDYQAELDQKYAHDLFAGHTSEEMQPHFSQCVIERSAELWFMPKIPFRYYMLGFRDFVMAGKFANFDAPDAASCFLRLVEEKLERQPDHIFPIMADLLLAIRYVGQNQSRFDATGSIYGNFREKLLKIETKYAHLQEYLKP